MRRRVPAFWPYALVTLVGVAALYFELFSHFNVVDDEGYVLLSLKQFTAGGALYEDVYSQYGPLYFEIFGAFFKATGVAVTHDNGRLIVVVIWSLTALGFGLVAQRLTSDRRLGVIAQIVALAILVTMSSEPMHPIGLTTLLGMVTLGALALWREDSLRGPLILGLAVGALLMIKVNLGALAAVGVIAAALIALVPARFALPARVLAIALLVAAPLVLVAAKLDAGWVRELLLLEFAGLAAIVIRAWGWRDETSQLRRPAFAAVGAALAVIVFSALLAIAIGTTPGELIDGTIVDPIRHPDVISSPLFIGWKVIVIAAVVLVAVAFYTFGLQARETANRLLSEGVLRVGAALGVWISITAAAPGAPDPGTKRLVLPILAAWLIVTPPRGLDEPAAKRFARLAIALVSVLGVLQAYPLGFSRLEAAATAFVLVGAVLAHDGLWILNRWRAEVKAAQRPLLDGALLAGMVATIAAFAFAGVLRPLERDARAFKQNRSVKVDGMSAVHLPAATAAGYEQLANAVRACAPLIVVPSFYSANLWSGAPTPTGQNANDWPIILNSERQQEIVAAAAPAAGLCVLVNADGTRLGIASSDERAAPRRPLLNYLLTTPMTRVLDIAIPGQNTTFTLWIRPRGAKGEAAPQPPLAGLGLPLGAGS